MENRETFVCYSSLPLNKVTPRLFDTFFKFLRIACTKYDVIVLAKNKKQLKYFKEKIPNLPVEYVLVEGVKGYDSNKKDFYVYPPVLREILTTKIKKCDIFYAFCSIGMTPMNVIKRAYEDFQTKDKILLKFIAAEAYYIATGVMSFMQEIFKPRMFVQMTDYNEPNLDGLFKGYPVQMLGFYDDPEMNYKHTYNVEYDKFTQLPEKMPKTYDFTFGYLVSLPTRKYLSEFIRKYVKENDKVKIRAQDRFWLIDGQKRDDLIPVAEYYKEQQMAKFTFAPPATLISEVSTERIWDAIVRDCIPIFMKCTNYKKCFKPDFCDFIEKNLVFDEDKWDSLNSFIDSLDYDDLLKRLKQVQSIKDLYNINESVVLKVFEKDN